MSSKNKERNTQQTKPAQIVHTEKRVNEDKMDETPTIGQDDSGLGAELSEMKQNVAETDSDSDDDVFVETLRSVLYKEINVEKGTPLKVKVVQMSNTTPAFNGDTQQKGDRQGQQATFQYAMVADDMDSALVQIKSLKQTDKWSVGKVFIIEEWSYDCSDKTLSILPNTMISLVNTRKFKTIQKIPDVIHMKNKLDEYYTKSIEELKQLVTNKSNINKRYHLVATVAQVGKKQGKKIRKTGEDNVYVRNVIVKDANGVDDTVTIGLWRKLADYQFEVGKPYIFYNVVLTTWQTMSLTTSFAGDTYIEEAKEWEKSGKINLKKLPEALVRTLESEKETKLYRLKSSMESGSLVYPACSARACMFKKLNPSNNCPKCGKSYHSFESALGCLLNVKVKHTEEKMDTVKMFTPSIEKLITESGQVFPKKITSAVTVDTILQMLPTGSQFNATAYKTDSGETILNITDITKIKKMA